LPAFYRCSYITRSLFYELKGKISVLKINP
jgi:hypothetical protein